MLAHIFFNSMCIPKLPVHRARSRKLVPFSEQTMLTVKYLKNLDMDKSSKIHMQLSPFLSLHVRFHFL